MGRKIGLQDLNENLRISKSEKTANPKTVKTRIARPKDLLSAFEIICEYSKDSGLDASLFKRLNTPIKYVSERLGVNANQCLLISLFVENSDDRCIFLNQFAQHMKCSTIKLLKFSTDLNELEKRRIIRCSRGDRRSSYRMPKEVVEAYSRDEVYEYKRQEKFDFFGLMQFLSAVFDERDEDELTYDSMVEEIDDVLADNSELDFVKAINSLCLETNERLLLLFYCHKHINENDDCIVSSDYEGLYDSNYEKNCIRSMIASGEHTLVENGWIEYVNHNGVAERSQTCLSAKAKRELFVGVALKSNEVNSSLMKSADIKEKKMYYTPDVNSQIDRLSRLLMPEEFNSVCQRLSDKGLRKGFATLFYGSPGTGKTETVYQIAKVTGRDIMCVDISSIKSCWVGESEKNIKAVFDRYRQIVDKSEVAPILLFNEADAVIGKRSENPERSVDKMENSIQNIILQEIENLEGILIATTNLSQNLDKAFERRFIYKIKFEKPDNKAKQSIWKSMIPEITDSVAYELAMMFDFSGGQIENIARKFLVDCVLNGDVKPEKQLEVLAGYCKDEMIVNTVLPVGFRRCG